MTIATVSICAPDELCSAVAQRVRKLAAACTAAALTPAVASAIGAIERQVGRLIQWPDGNGGAHVFIESVELGAPFLQLVTWIAFHVPHTLPDGDIYPFWIRDDLARTDGAPIGKTDAVGRNFMHRNQTWFDEPAVMISLRSNQRDRNVDSPARKLARVLATIRNS